VFDRSLGDWVNNAQMCTFTPFIHINGVVFILAYRQLYLYPKVKDTNTKALVKTLLSEWDLPKKKKALHSSFKF
jgi:hypothetical protein